ncbi:hypothetical protein PCANC_11049 [Puccinia coronata f. sp. avenae]|uniref:Uncharacterized protein n=1 Tax=Puccinia coronata f. sp. avenae TaxID=200324 RepID=A0A2N5UVV0_9BASI|nr:hypothetical protein PCANC_11049 [Puccinia coronata f. sp. avenae]
MQDVTDEQRTVLVFYRLYEDFYDLQAVLQDYRVNSASYFYYHDVGINFPFSKAQMDLSYILRFISPSGFGFFTCGLGDCGGGRTGYRSLPGHVLHQSEINKGAGHEVSPIPPESDYSLVASKDGYRAGRPTGGPFIRGRGPGSGWRFTEFFNTSPARQARPSGQVLAGSPSGAHGPPPSGLPGAPGAAVLAPAGTCRHSAPV